jgi:transposase InsO family protein
VHGNAPLTPAGRLRLCLRVADGRPIAHVAAEAGISRRCLAKWYGRWLADGSAGLEDRTSRPASSPAATPLEIGDLVEELRRTTKYGPARIAAELERRHGVVLAAATVHRILARRGLNRLRDLDPPTGEDLRQVIRYEYERPGDLIHVDVKKLGRIPAGGGWRAHGIGTPEALASRRVGPGTGKVGYTYLHSAVDDHSRLAYTEALDDERGTTAAAFWHRAAAFFAAHDVTDLRRVLTDNGSCYRSTAWADALTTTSTTHKRTRPYTPRTNGKVERFNGTLAREWAYVRAYASEHERSAALADFLNHYNHKRPHSALGGSPPISRVTDHGFRLAADVVLDPPDPLPVQLTIEEDAVEPTS